MKIIVNGEETEVDLNLGSLRLSEAVQVEELVGPEAWERLVAGNAPSPSVVQALVLVKLRADYPGLKAGDFDFDLADLDIEPAGKE